MAESGAQLAREEQSVVGTWDRAPVQGAFIGRLAIAMIAVLVLCALIGISAGLMG